VTVLLPDELQNRFTTDDIRLHLALGMYFDRRVTLGQGAAIAGISQSDFLRELGERRIPVHYDLDDARADVAAAERWSR
jgi:predicted HTH domain antitoxin